MKKVAYPLEQVLEVKKDRVDKAEKVVNERKKAHEIELEKLAKVEKERDQVRHHHQEKLTQLRNSLDSGTTSPEILQMKSYLKVVKERLAKEEIKVQKQKEQVATALKHLQEAQADLQRKRVEWEKIKMHKEEWEKEQKRALEHFEAKESDEIGMLVYEAEKRKRERGEK